MVHFREICLGSLPFGASYTNFRQPHVVECQIYGKKNFVLLSSKYGNFICPMLQMSDFVELRLVCSCVDSIF
jgi:hypothetical protein